MDAPVVPIHLETVLLVVSAVSYIVQVVGWLWVRRLARRLVDKPGGELAHIIAFLMGWTLVARFIGLAGLVYYDLSHSTDLVVAMSIFSNVFFLVIVFEVWRRIRNFMDAP